MEEVSHNSFFFLIFNNLAIARPVSSVYRADSRAPSDVFSNGFHAWGTNINFNAHIQGVSGRRGTRDSAFIPTTSSLQAAERFSMDLLNVSPSQVSYIYHVRPTHNFYSALTTIHYIYDFAGVRIPDSIRRVISEEQEYSAYQQIQPELVRSVTIYTRLSDGTIRTSEDLNPRYQPGSTAYFGDCDRSFRFIPIT